MTGNPGPCISHLVDGALHVAFLEIYAAATRKNNVRAKAELERV
jgi:hypothetical protein